MLYPQAVLLYFVILAYRTYKLVVWWSDLSAGSWDRGNDGDNECIGRESP